MKKLFLAGLVLSLMILGACGETGDDFKEQASAPETEFQNSFGLSIWSQIAAGTGYNCGIKTDNTLYCWGANFLGQLGDGTTINRNSPKRESANGTDWFQVSAGLNHTCAVRTTGTLWCWGDNYNGQVGDGTMTYKLNPTQESTNAADWAYVSVGGNTTCALKTGGSLYCWGENTYGQFGNGTTGYQNLNPTQIGTSLWIKISNSYNHTCGIKTDGSLFCWGSNQDGELGIGSKTIKKKTTPARVGKAKTWTDISVGGADSGKSCGIMGGKLYCWGNNWKAFLVGGTNKKQLSPFQIGTKKNWTRVDVLEWHQCAINLSGELACWGDNSYGQLGNGKAQSLPGSALSLTALIWTQVQVGDKHTCGLIDTGLLYCWGNNEYGQIGNSIFGEKVSPVQIGADSWLKIAGGLYSACAIKSDNTIFCWGKNDYGQLGDGTKENRKAPVQVGTDIDWGEIAVGGAHACAKKTDNSIWCWGKNKYGQLGIGNNKTKTVPVRAGTNYTWQILTVGREHTCATRADGTLWCWGYNKYGQLGIGTTENKNVPTKVGKAIDWAFVDAGAYHTCAVKTSGALFCWGQNNSGYLGIGTFTNAKKPTQVGTDMNWSSVSAGYNHTCAVKTDNTLYCWGSNAFGQLGDGTNTDQFAPVQEAQSYLWYLTGLSAGDNHTCAIKTDNTLWCWGSNSVGAVGDGTRTDRSSPTRESTLASTWTKLAAGWGHNCALKSDNSLHCWGYNSFGELGDNTGWYSLPVNVP